MGMSHVVSLHRYPVKSMMGEELNATEVDEFGLLGDRAYAIVDSSTGSSQRQEPSKVARLVQLPGHISRNPEVWYRSSAGPHHPTG